MGWRDQSTPLNAAPAPVAPATTSPNTPASSGWRSTSAPLSTTPVTPAVVPKQPAAAAPPATDDDAALYAGGAYPDAQRQMASARVAGNTFGLWDRLASGQWGYGSKDPALEAERAKTAAASKLIGPVGTAAMNVVGAAPLMPLMPTGALAGMGASGIAGGTAAYGHDENIPVGIAAGMGTSLAGSGVAKALNPLVGRAANAFGRATGMLSTPEDVIAATQAAKTAAYAPTKQINFDAWRDVNNAYYDAFNSLEADQRQNLSAGFNTKFSDHINANASAGTVTASNIDGFGRDLQSATRSPADKVLAQRTKENLDDVLQNATPIGPNAPAPGVAADQMTDARAAAQRLIMAQGLSKASTDLTRWGDSPSPFAKEQYEFYDPKSDVAKGLLKLYQTGAKGTQLSSQGITHGVMNPIAEAVGGAVAGAPGAITAEAGVQLLKPQIGGMLKKLYAAQSQNAISQLYPSATGMTTKFFPDVKNPLVNLALSQEAGAGR
jgi:hypothetical protein